MNCGKAAREATLECPILQYNVIFTFILNTPFSILHYVNRKINLLNHWAFSPIMRFERGLPMKNKRMRYISITAAILLVFVLLMLLFSNRSGDFSAMEAQDGVLDATSADFSSAVYEIDGEWTFYPEVLGSGAELDAAQPGERDESIPYGSYRLKIHAQPKQYLTLGGYSFDYSTRVLVNGSKVLEIGKVGRLRRSLSRASTTCSYRFTPARMARSRWSVSTRISCTAKAAV